MKNKLSKKWKRMEKVEFDNSPERWGRVHVGIPDECWTNNIYSVWVYWGEKVPKHEDWPDMVWLSIKRHDREPIFDWRAMQNIKNDIVGENHEAVSLFPSEERLMDEANQYHLFCLADTGYFPFGFKKRVVLSPKTAEKAGAKQRKTNDFQ
jgi:hypothetical protein|tara:strand:+ start:84 stop:536 length:453 start_codon:yes stop_codon:yes gene_type:complete